MDGEGPHCPACGQPAHTLPLLHLFFHYRSYVYQCGTCTIKEAGSHDSRPLRWIIDTNGNSIDIYNGNRIG